MEEQPFDFNTPITEDTLLVAKYDCPNGVTLNQLKTALNNGTAATTYPINTQIDDYTDGHYDPWIVGHYGKQYGDNDTDGVYLYRKYLYPELKAWGAGDTYDTSEINTWLNSTYLNTCSDEIKGMVEQIDVPLVSGTVSAKMFLMSAGEVMAVSTGYAGGVEWDSWKERTGLSQPSSDPNAGRILSHGELANGTGDTWLTRTVMNDQNNVAAIEGDGACRGINASTEAGVAVACFIAKAKYDPSSPTLTGLKEALDAGDYEAFPVGTEIPDEWNGQSNPLIVAQYLDSTNNETYNGAEGVILVRKYVGSVAPFGGYKWSTSSAKDYLNSEYYNNCSDDIKNIISDITVRFKNNETSTIDQATSKWFLMSGIEVGATYNSGEGIFWDYWKKKTGWTSGNDSANAGRTTYNIAGQQQSAWTRSYSVQAILLIGTGGAMGSLGPTTNNGLLPACFIAKTATPAKESLSAEEYDNLDLTAEAYDNYDLTAEEYDTNGKNLLK